MVQTVNSNATSYLGVQDFLNRTDVRKVCQLVSDTTAAVPLASLTSNTVLLALLAENSGILEMACTLGQRYDPTDLALLAASGTVGAQTIFKIISIGTWNALTGRRLDLNIDVHPQTTWAEEMLEQLANGVRIFPFVQAQAAGVAAHKVETEWDIQKRNGMVYQAARKFGRRADRQWFVWQNA